MSFPPLCFLPLTDKVTRCWRKENGKWVLRDIAFTEEWDDKDYIQLVRELRQTLKTGGAVFGAFLDKSLIGFASLDNALFESAHQYLQLSELHISFGYRGNGIGRQLFRKAAEAAKMKGAEALYISAHSAEESQAFYRAVGCRKAAKYNQKSAEKEPCDCQLEYLLSIKTENDILSSSVFLLL